MKADYTKVCATEHKKLPNSLAKSPDLFSSYFSPIMCWFSFLFMFVVRIAAPDIHSLNKFKRTMNLKMSNQMSKMYFCVIRTGGHTVYSERQCLKKWMECSVNEDYYSTCDSLNSSGFVLLHPRIIKWLLKDFLSPYHMPNCLNLFLNNVSIHSKSSF